MSNIGEIARDSFDGYDSEDSDFSLDLTDSEDEEPTSSFGFFPNLFKGKKIYEKNCSLRYSYPGHFNEQKREWYFHPISVDLIKGKINDELKENNITIIKRPIKKILSPHINYLFYFLIQSCKIHHYDLNYDSSSAFIMPRFLNTLINGLITEVSGGNQYIRIKLNFILYFFSLRIKLYYEHIRKLNVVKNKINDLEEIVKNSEIILNNFIDNLRYFIDEQEKDTFVFFYDLLKSITDSNMYENYDEFIKEHIKSFSKLIPNDKLNLQEVFKNKSDFNEIDLIYDLNMNSEGFKYKMSNNSKQAYDNDWLL